MKKQLMQVLWLLVWVLFLTAGMLIVLTCLSEMAVVIFCTVITVSYIMWKAFADSENT